MSIITFKPENPQITDQLECYKNCPAIISESYGAANENSCMQCSYMMLELQKLLQQINSQG